MVGICNDAAQKVLGLSQGDSSLDYSGVCFKLHRENDGLDVNKEFSTIEMLNSDTLLPLNENVVFYKGS